MQNNNDPIKGEFMHELLRQAKLTFNLALSVTAASAMMTLGGVGLLYFNKVSEASLTAGGGALATITSVQLAKQTREELLQILEKSDG
ncbi:TRADD-N-associated membrane domain-containing protein [Nostoc sp.]|uniref:TRADD-N-associated membrane domain-containing protein n=1 Tax=Nostoc sp. TaxID=1180 RepID=UPI002FFCFA6B